MDRGAAFAARLALPIRDFDLLEQALVHSSWLHEHPEGARGHNERLEFLGDAVINLVISDALYLRHPTDDEGLLSARRAAIVSSVGLARLAGRIELGRHLLLGEGEAARGGRRRPVLLSQAFEAVAGAIFLDLGWERTRDWILGLAEPELNSEAPIVSLKSPKSQLQEWTQQTTGARPQYRVLEALGPDHDKLFRIEVRVDGQVLGRGEGASRRIAETHAAAEALEAIARGEGPAPRYRGPQLQAGATASDDPEAVAPAATDLPSDDEAGPAERGGGSPPLP